MEPPRAFGFTPAVGPRDAFHVEPRERSDLAQLGAARNAMPEGDGGFLVGFLCAFGFPQVRA